MFSLSREKEAEIVLYEREEEQRPRKEKTPVLAVDLLACAGSLKATQRRVLERTSSLSFVIRTPQNFPR